MSERLVIEETPFGARALRLRDGQASELLFEDIAGIDVVDRLFIGIIRRIDAELNAAFVDIGLDAHAWFGASDARLIGRGDHNDPMQQRFYEGQRILVQGIRAPRDGKGARVGADVALPGHYLVHRPRRKALELSGRLPNKDARALHARASRLLPSPAFTVRASAIGCTDVALVDEAERLIARWKALKARFDDGAPPGPLGDEDALARLVRKGLNGQVGTIEALSAKTALRLRQLDDVPDIVQGDDPARIDAHLDDLLQPDVLLDNDVRLTIEPTRALVAIDIDGGRSGLSPKDINRTAVREAARQVQLRGLGGLVVLDTIDLRGKDERDALHVGARSAFLQTDPSARVLPPSPLGLIEISIRQRGPSLAERYAVRSLHDDDAHHGSPRLAAERLARALTAGPQAAASARLGLRLKRFLDQQGREAWQAFLGQHGLTPRLHLDGELSPCGYVIDPDSA